MRTLGNDFHLDKKDLLQSVAQVCFEAMRAFTHGTKADELSISWMQLPLWAKDTYIERVDYVLSRMPETVGPEELHTEWIRMRTALGWRFGNTLSLKEKTDPSLVEWDKLGKNYKLKARLFLGIVYTFTNG